jgi:hypothetical protein
MTMAAELFGYNSITETTVLFGATAVNYRKLASDNV